ICRTNKALLLFFFQAEDGIRDRNVTGVQTCALPISPTAEGQEQLLEEEPELETWVSAVQSAKGRTGDNLGVDYATISEQLWTAVQNALSGAAEPADALETAQAAAAEALGS